MSQVCGWFFLVSLGGAFAWMVMLAVRAIEVAGRFVLRLGRVLPCVIAEYGGVAAYPVSA